MSEDITKELPMTDSEKLSQLLTISRNVIAGMNQMDARLTAVENDLASLKAGTNPFWQVMHDQQVKILATVQDHTGRIERIEAHLKKQDEKMDAGFRKLGDKFDLMAQDYYDLRADVVDVNRRVTRLEPVN